MRSRSHALRAAILSVIALHQELSVREVHRHVELGPGGPVSINSVSDYLATNFGDAAYVDLRFRNRIAFQPLMAKGE